MDDYYRVLGLEYAQSQRRGGDGLIASDIRKAYHAALLKHHPDKAATTTAVASQSGRGATAAATDGTTASSSPSSQSHERPTVDLITTAYKTLSDPTAKAEYDRLFLHFTSQSASAAAHLHAGAAARFFSGLDTVDLDDLDYDEDRGVWRRPCRCEHDEAFVVTEEDLEEVAAHGELIVGCRGCSLWLKVLFQPAPHVLDENVDENA